MNIGGEGVDRSQPNNNITSKSNPHFLWGISYKDILLANVDGNVKWNIPVESLPTDKQKWYYKVHNWKSIWLDFPNFSCDLILTKREESEIYSLPQHTIHLQLYKHINRYACIVKQNVDSRKENYKQGDILLVYETLITIFEGNAWEIYWSKKNWYLKVWT